MANEINAERIQQMIQTALAAQAQVYNTESADRERILLAVFSLLLWYIHTTTIVMRQKMACILSTRHLHILGYSDLNTTYTTLIF